MGKTDPRARGLNLFANRLKDTCFAFGGLYGNAISATELRAKHPKSKELKSLLTGTRKEGWIEWDKAPEELWHIWFAYLRDAGINALRLFPRMKDNGDVLDLCGRVNKPLLELMERYIATAADYGIGFSLIVMPEPTRTGYLKKPHIKKFVIPHFKKSEIAKLPAAQKRFVQQQKTVSLADYFIDPDVWACQRLYLDELVAWIKTQPQIFSLEVVNEQGWWNEKFHWEDEEATEAWGSRIVDYLHKKIKKLPVCISHPGFGILGYEPLRWTRETPIDYYSPHLYCGIGGAKRGLDFGLVSDLVINYASALKPAFLGEWGIVSDKVDARLRQLALRDALWFSILNASPGMFQWINAADHNGEYKQARAILDPLTLDKLPRQMPLVGVDVSKTASALDSRELYEDRKGDPWEFAEKKALGEAFVNLERCTEYFLNHGVAFDFTLTPQDYKYSGEASRFQEIEVPPDHCLFAFSPSYQCKYAAFGEWEVIVAYFRNVEPVVAGGFNLRAQAPRPFQVAWQLPKRPRGAKGGPWHYRLTVYNLDTGEEKGGRVARDSSVDFGNDATNDFVFVFQR